MLSLGWKENLATFMNELKNLHCYTMTTMGVAVKQAFDVLNINRMTSGIDTYGQGRCPFFLETAVIVLITDGGKLTTGNFPQMLMLQNLISKDIYKTYVILFFF